MRRSDTPTAKDDEERAQVEGELAKGMLAELKPLIDKGICREPFTVRASKEKTTDDAKLVHWCRHGEAWHNFLALLHKRCNMDGRPYGFAEGKDSHLTPRGRTQAAALREKARKLGTQLVVVSPLARATKTALIAFDHLEGKVPFVAQELCREISGVNPCDARQTRTEAKKDFPLVDYSLLASDEDDHFNADRRESKEALCNRSYGFLDWLRGRTETEIAVCTHSSFLFALFNVVLKTDDMPGTELAAWFGTGQMRSVYLSFEGGRLQGEAAADAAQQRQGGRNRARKRTRDSTDSQGSPETTQRTALVHAQT